MIIQLMPLTFLFREMSPAVFSWNFPLIDEADETDDNDSDASSVNCEYLIFFGFK